MEEARQRIAEAPGEYGVRALQEFTGGEMGRLSSAAGWRPTSLHLRSALMRDQYGVEYTPEKAGLSTVFHVRMPKSASLKITRMLKSGETPDPYGIGLFCFPQPGTELELARIHDKSADPVLAVVRELLDVRAGSARIVLDHELDVTHTEAEARLFAKRAERNQVALLETEGAEGR